MKIWSGWPSSKSSNTLQKLEQEKPMSLGQWGELVAQKEYQKHGFDILGANFSNTKGKRLGEIDFIARKDGLVVFVEVKTRSGEGSLSSALEAVGTDKQKRLRLAARFFMYKFPHLADRQFRFDVCAVLVERFDKQKFSVKILEDVI